MMRKVCATATVALLPLAIAACGNADSSAGDSGAVSYWLWDSNQQPAYEKCAAAFEDENPDVTVEITQVGWDDYWSKLTTGFVSGTAPDVFTNHLAKYPDFINKKTILPLDDLAANDPVDLSVYVPGLADLWVGEDGKRYGFPKDWDTIAVFYNQQLTEEAGITAEDLAAMAWNPTDGGSYEEVIARLTVDKNGVRGDEEGFDKDSVEIYGLWLESSGNGVGQTQWSMYAVSNGWQFTDTNPWGNQYHYDDPKLQETIAWWKSLIDKGYMPPLPATSGVSWNDMLAAGKAAMATNGSWMIGSVFGATSDSFTPAVAPLPAGPTGSRMSMFNGLADSIYVGSKNKDAAWKWVRYLASVECQEVVGEHAVVFPAIPSAIEIAQEEFAAKGVDVTAFTVNVEEGTTFLYPITDHPAQIESVMQPAMDAVIGGSAPVESLSVANDQVNALFR